MLIQRDSIGHPEIPVNSYSGSVLLAIGDTLYPRRSYTGLSIGCWCQKGQLPHTKIPIHVKMVSQAAIPHDSYSNFKCKDGLLSKTRRITSKFTKPTVDLANQNSERCKTLNSEQNVVATSRTQDATGFGLMYCYLTIPADQSYVAFSPTLD